MLDIKIRPATLEDLPILYSFEQGIIIAERPFDPTLAPDHISYYDLRALILAKDTEVIVALKSAKIIASAYAQLRDAKDYLDHERYAYLGFMFVLPDFRGLGVNGKIIEALEIWIRNQGVQEIRLDVYADNEAALIAYTKKGFKGHILNMRKRLQD